MLKKYIIPVLLLLLLIGNRSISQSFSFGGIYYYEIALIIAFLSKPKKIFRILLGNFPALLLLIYVVVIIIIEAITSDINTLVFRRAALGIYIVTPIILIAFLSEIKQFFKNNFNYIIGLLFLFSSLQYGGFQPTMAAQLVGAFIVFELVSKRRSFHLYVFCLIYFILVSGITTGQSIFRTPILTTIAGISVALYLSKNKLLTVNSLPNYFLGAIIFIALISTGALDSVIGNIIVGISGLFDSKVLLHAGSQFGSDISSTRGDAAGNAETRIIFWTAIFNYQFSDLKSFIFGSGLQYGFMEVTLPDLPFNDKHLVDPHNSFINLFFRFGLVGFILYVWAISGVCRYINLTNNRNGNFLPYLVIAVIFASFEVVLENPHGVLIFWFIFFIPVIFSNQSSIKIKPLPR